MLKKSLFFGLSVFFLLALVIWNYVNTSNLHRPLKVENIARITLWGREVHKEASEQEVINIVNWFNSAYDIRETFGGTTAESGINIEEKNGTKFGMGLLGENFDVHLYDQKGKPRSYEARQKEIQELLNELAKRP